MPLLSVSLAIGGQVSQKKDPPFFSQGCIFHIQILFHMQIARYYAKYFLYLYLLYLIESILQSNKGFCLSVCLSVA